MKSFRPILLTATAALSAAVAFAASTALPQALRMRVAPGQARTVEQFIETPGASAASLSRPQTLWVAVSTIDDTPDSDIDALPISGARRFGPGIVTGRVDADGMRALLSSSHVSSIMLDRKMTPTTLYARTWCNIDKVHSGEGLQQGYTGKGVLYGIFDTGIDFNHINFKDADGNSRVQHAWIYHNGELYSEASTPDEIAALTTDNAGQNHGSHTLGIGAGSYNLDGFYGVAPDAQLLVAGGDGYFSEMLDALANMTDIAEAQGKRLVYNLSWGNTLGPHDGLSTINKLFDSYADRGVIITMASGNDGNGVTSARGYADADGNITVLVKDSDICFRYGIAFFAADDKPFGMSVEFLDTATGAGLGAWSEEMFADESIEFGPEDISETLDRYFGPDGIKFYHEQGLIEQNRYCRYLDFDTRAWVYPSVTAVFNFTGLTPGSRFEAYNDGAQYLRPTSTVPPGHQYTNVASATADGTVSDMACGFKNITVGNFTSHSPAPATEPDGDMCKYSSWGTLIDGRSLPHIVAPGYNVLSSINRYSNRTTSTSATVDGSTYYWVEMGGTSMSSPFVAGVIATWLEAVPTLTWEQARDIMQRTAIHTSYYDGTPRWGAGLIDGHAGLREALVTTTSITDVDGADTGVKPLLRHLGDGVCEVSLPGCNSLDIALYGIDGSEITAFKANGDVSTVTLPAAGIYIVSVNGRAVKVTR